MSTLAPERKLLTTASQAPLIVNGTPRQVYDHWLVRTGQAEPEDLSNSFEVQWGKHNERFVLDWVEKSTQLAINERQRFLIHPTMRWMGCTLDGVQNNDTVVECKILDPYKTAEEFTRYYGPQLVVQRSCREVPYAMLIVQQGNHPPRCFNVPIDEEYEQQVFDRLAAFQKCVDERIPPGPPPPSPVPPALWKTIDLSERPLPNWAHALMPTLDQWRATKAIADEHNQTKLDVKSLLPDYVGRVIHGNITVKRNRNNAITIVEQP